MPEKRTATGRKKEEPASILAASAPARAADTGPAAPPRRQHGCKEAGNVLVFSGQILANWGRSVGKFRLFSRLYFNPRRKEKRNTKERKRKVFRKQNVQPRMSLPKFVAMALRL